MRKLLFCLASVALLAACQSVPESIPEGLSQPELFQRAQDAFSDGNYAAAELYYETFLDRFPDDKRNRIAARYEIAYIYYKRGNLDEAQRRFRDILDRYEQAEQQSAEGGGQSGQSAGGQTGQEGSVAGQEGGSGDGSASGGSVGGDTGQAGQGLDSQDSFGATRAPGAQGGELPEWPRVLSQRLLEIIEEERRESDALLG